MTLPALLAASAALSWGCGSPARPSRVDTASPQSTVPLVGLPVIAHPRGWQPIDFGRLRLWLPSSWQSNTSINGCMTTTYDNLVTLEPPTNGCDHKVTTHLSVRLSTHVATTGWQASTINGVAVWSHQTSGATTFAIPSLGMRLTATGDGALGVVRTLGPSPFDALMSMTGPVAVPRRWRPVRFDGFQVDVPTKWSISNVSADCGTLFSGSPSAYEGEPRFTASCALVLPVYLLRPRNGVWLERVAGR